MTNEKTSNSNYYNAGRFLINVGMIKRYGKEILKNQWNEFVLLGVIKKDKKYKLIINDDEKAKKMIQAMIKTYNIDNKAIKSLIEYIQKNKNDDLEIMLLKLIINNTDLVCNKKYKDYLLSKIQKYNKANKGIMGELLYNPHSEKKVLEKYSYDEICIILENFRYSVFNLIDEFFLNDLFEKYPKDLRLLLKQKIIDNPNTNLYNSYSHINLTECKNYNEERYNNLSLCIELLSQNDYYKISNYIHYLVGDYNDKLGEDILKFLEKNDTYDNYKNVIDLCRLFDVSIECWKIYEFIISRIELDDELLDEIECLLFNTGVVNGEYGIANSFYNKHVFFKKIKSKDEKVRQFVNKQVTRFKTLYQDEKSKRDKRKIINKMKYNLENSKADD